MQSLHDSTWLAFWMAEQAVGELWPDKPFFDRRFGAEEDLETGLIREIWDPLPAGIQNFLRHSSWRKKNVRVKAKISLDADVMFDCVMGKIGDMPWQPLAISITAELGAAAKQFSGRFVPEVVRSHRFELVA